MSTTEKKNNKQRALEVCDHWLNGELTSVRKKKEEIYIYILEHLKKKRKRGENEINRNKNRVRVGIFVLFCSDHILKTQTNVRLTRMFS